MKQAYDYLIVGAGLTGCVLAERLTRLLNKKVLVVDKRNHIAGNCYDYTHENTDILIHEYGPHIFHTENKAVWDYLAQYTRWEPYFHHVKAYVDGIATDLPFNLNSIYQVFPSNLAKKLENILIETYSYGRRLSILDLLNADSDELKFLVKFVYEKVFLNYTVKQWGVAPESIDQAVLERVPVLISRDSRYFQDRYQGMPADGYTKMMEKMLDHNNINLLLNTSFKDIQHNTKYDRLIYTGAIDEYYNYTHGELPFRSMSFDFRFYPTEYYQEAASINYPNDYDFTRITEFKHFNKHSEPAKNPQTVVALEYPDAYKRGENEPSYPIPDPRNHELLKLYEEAALKEPNTLFAGRLGHYRYYNMDKAVESALTLFDKLKAL